MCKLAGAELRPTLEKLLEVYAEAQSQRVAAGLGRIQIIRSMLDRLLRDAESAAQDNAKFVENVEREPEKLQGFITQIETKIALLDSQAEELDALNLSMSEAPVLKAA